MKNYYNILEVEKFANQDQIKAQYYFLMHAWHPDKFPTPDQKAKAEEKVKEINEAYNILGDPLKRKIYDGDPHPPTSQPPSPRHTQPVQEQTSQNDHLFCDVCKQPAQTKNVSFYQNIGMIVVRKHKSVKGFLCKNCIDYFFWEFTGKTIILGWWGTISFIITPFILLNNLITHISSIGIKRPLVRSTPPTPPVWVFTTIAGFIFIAYTAFTLIAFPTPTYSYPSTSTSVPTKNAAIKPTPKPTQVPTKARTSTPQGGECYYWDEVTPSMIGRFICVYGNVYKTRNVGASTYQVLFDNSQTSFFLAAGAHYYTINSGECVLAEGEVLSSSVGVPYINIDEALYYCEPWMK